MTRVVRSPGGLYLATLAILAVAAVPLVAEFVLHPGGDLQPARIALGGESLLAALHVAADILIGVAYVVIAAFLVRLARAVGGALPFVWAFAAFGLFIVACGLSHMTAALTMWEPTWWLAGGVKYATAMVSLAMAVATPSLVPRVLRVVEAARVADRRQAELATSAAALRLQEQRFRGIFDNAFQFTGLLSPDGTLLEANRAALAFAGLTAADVVGRPFWEARWWTISPATQQRLREAIAAAAGGAFVRYEVEVRGAGDATAIIDFSLKPVHDDDGAVVLLIPEGRDVTELRRTEAALRDSEARFAAYMANLPGYAWIKDADLNYVYANPRLTATWGDQAGAVFGTDGAAVTPTGMLAAVQASDREALASDGATERTWRVLGPDGQDRAWQSHKFPFAAPDGTHLLGALAFDVTDRERLAVTLRDSEERFRRAFEDAAIGMALLALDGRWLRVNRAVCDITGYSEPELLATTFRDITHPDDLDADLAQVRRLLAGEISSYQMEKRYLRKDGSLVWILLSGTLLRDDLGAPLQFIAQIQDITARKRAEAEVRTLTAELEARVAARTAELAVANTELAEANERYRFMADAMPQIVWTSGPDGNLDYYNQRWYDYTGLNYEQTKGWGWEPVIHPDDLATTVERWTHAYTSGQDYEVEYRFRQGSDGSYRWHLGRAKPRRDGEGRIVQWFGTSTDIDDQKRAVEATTAANEELEAFAYSVSHDLRAPLRAIDGFSRVLDEDFAPELSDEARRYLGRVRANAQKMGQLIDDLLAFSRLGRRELAVQPVDPARIAREAWEDLLPTLADRSIALAIDDLPPTVADRALLRQVFANLLGNAAKFTWERNPARIEVGGRRDPGETVYWVRDNGVGFDPRHTAKLFGVFQRLHRAEDFEGTGVGLALVQRIVSRHGGRVWAEGTPGEGATFWFSLPVRPDGDTASDTEWGAA